MAFYGVKLSLLILSISACYLTWYLMYNNGTFSAMALIRGAKPLVLPGTKAPVKTSYVGIGAVDEQLTVLTLFFWEIVDGSMPNASLQAFRFGGQFAAAWGLILVEGMRAGNQGRAVSLVMIWGLLIQNITLAVIMPLYFILHLSTSPTLSSSRQSDLRMNTSKLASIPISISLGFILPGILMSLPAPSVQSFESKQTFLALWQTFPIWIEILQLVVSSLISQIDTRTRSAVPAEASNVHCLRILRFVYGFLLVTASTTQISALTVTATSMLFPALFAPGFRGIFNPSKVLVPLGVTPSAKMSSVGSGNLQLLQYDEMISSTAMVLWASTLLVSAYKSTKNKKFDRWAALFLGGGAVAFLAGPMGCAIVLCWVRDELVLGSKDATSKKAL